MKPATHTLSDLFGADVRYIVPLYQRPYVWKRDSHWLPLWGDVEEILGRQLDSTAPSTSHFMGAVVLDQQETPPGEAVRRLVIDGQQRLTTLQLLLTAAWEEAQVAGAERAARLLRRLTRNNEDLTSGDERFKVWPTNANQAAFRAVMGADGQSTGPDDPGNTIHEAHEFFRQQIRAWSREGHPTPEELEERFDGLRVVLDSLLHVVSINLESGDNAQVIFETLNARGTPLLAMDLVKNAVFYKAAQSGLDTDVLHDEVWEPELGQSYWRQMKRQGRLNRPRAELFLTHWLAMRLQRVVNAGELFSEFRTHILDKTDPTEVEALIRELCRDAAVMRSFDSQPEGSVEEQFFRHLEVMDTTTVLPVALQLFSHPQVSVERRSRGIAAIESWLVRRMLVGLTTKNYNRSVGDLLKRIAADPEHADEQIIDELSGSDAVTQSWPTDREVIQGLVSRPLYGWVAQRRVVMVLGQVELARRRGNRKVEDVFTLPPKLTLEHVMPQKWREHWPISQGDPEAAEAHEAARDAVLHRLGNLTLTSGPLNSSLSNAAWASKRVELQGHSLLLLNTELAQTELWDVEQINRRGYELALEICGIWPSPLALLGRGQEVVTPSLEAVLSAAAAATSAASSGEWISLAALLEAGFLEEGETLSTTRANVHWTAVVLGDGRLACRDQVFDTPTGAAKAAAEVQAINGWKFWRAERDGEFVSLDDIRSQYSSSTASN